MLWYLQVFLLGASWVTARPKGSEAPLGKQLGSAFPDLWRSTRLALWKLPSVVPVGLPAGRRKRKSRGELERLQKQKKPSLPRFYPSAARPSYPSKIRRFPSPSYEGFGFVGIRVFRLLAVLFSSRPLTLSGQRTDSGRQLGPYAARSVLDLRGQRIRGFAHHSPPRTITLLLLNLSQCNMKIALCQWKKRTLPTFIFLKLCNISKENPSHVGMLFVYWHT